jgi:hypothetical protein
MSAPARSSLIRVARHELDDGTRDLLGKEVAARVAAADLDSDANEAILASIGAHALSEYLPGQFLRALTLYAATGAHALILANLPVQEFPPTPVSGFGTETDLAVTNALHFGLIQILGLTPYAVEYENDGRLIRNVVPNPAASGTTSSWGADSEFSWHTDNPHLPFGGPGLDPRRYVPRYLTFYAVRNDERVPTELAAVADATAALDATATAALRRADFEVGAPASNDTRHALAGTPVLEHGPDGDRARFDKGTTRALTPSASAALGDWSGALASMPARELVLNPGEFLIFDNYRVLHRRRAFTPGPAPTARWLRRCYAS